MEEGKKGGEGDGGFCYVLMQLMETTTGIQMRVRRGWKSPIIVTFDGTEGANGTNLKGEKWKKFTGSSVM
jgi:hypothetical protein